MNQMKSKRYSMRTPLIALAGTALLATGACTTDPETGRRGISSAAVGGLIGAGGGYLLGDLVGGRRDRTEKILGAGIGAIAGAGVGAYMDKQERELRQKTAGTDVDVVRQGDQLVLNMPSGITFDTNEAAIQPRFRTTLDQVAQTLSQYDQTYIDVYGHTDSSGPDAYNQTLSERRAQSVASYLSSRGIQSARIATQGFGESQPVADNMSEAGRAENRRVEIRIAPITEQDVRGAG